MPVSQSKTSGELIRVPVPDNSGNGCGRTSSRLAYLAGLHVVSLACTSRQPHAKMLKSQMFGRAGLPVLRKLTARMNAGKLIIS